jgi:hypothetical protein
MASGKLDGLATVVGVVVGSLVAGELLSLPAVQRFNDSGFLGNVYLYDLLNVPPAVIAAAVAAVAVAAFVGAEKIEAIFGKGAAPASSPTPRRLVFAGMGALATVGLVTLGLPRGTSASPVAPAALSAETLARRVIEAPWKVRVLDVRSLEACGKARVPGAECVPAADLGKLGLADATPERLLVLVGEGALSELPADARAYRGEVAQLEGGFASWQAYALTPPAPPAATASPAELEAWKVRAGLHAALTGVKQAPPPAPVPGAAPSKRKPGGGGCSG